MKQVLPFPSPDERPANKFARCVADAPNEETLMAWYEYTQNPVHQETIRAEILKRHVKQMVRSSHRLEFFSIVLAILTLVLVLDVAFKFYLEFFKTSGPIVVSPLPAPPKP